MKTINGNGGSRSANKIKVSPRQLPQTNPPFCLSSTNNNNNNKNEVKDGTGEGGMSTSSSSASSSSSTTQFSEYFEGVARLLHGRKNVVVLVGAGISVACGIPDFRSRDSGLYQTLDLDSLGLTAAEDLFDYDYFLEDPSAFYSFARNLYFPLGIDKRVEPSDSHKFLAMLAEKKMLLRVYSQNIDGLENMAGVPNKKMVYAHGSLKWATCCKCSKKVDCEEILPFIKRGAVAYCQKSTTTTNAKKSKAHSDNNNNNGGGGAALPSSPRLREREPSQRVKKRQRRSTTSVEEYDDNICGGVYKPAVTFFGETLNDNVRKSLEADREKVDAVIVIGTSLSVAPISKVIEYMPCNIPRILINRTIVHPSSTTTSSASPTPITDNEGDDVDDPEETEFRENYVFDAYLLGFCDDVTRALARQLFNVPSAENGLRTKTKATSTRSSSSKGNRSSKKLLASSSSNNNQDNLHHGYGGRLLSTVLDGNDDEHDSDEWAAAITLPQTTVPAERVLLFHGALASKDTETTDVKYKEIAHCDGCSKQIRGVIQKCMTCFDYDLCSKCFPRVSKTHYGGKHTFSREPS